MKEVRDLKDLTIHDVQLKSSNRVSTRESFVSPPKAAYSQVDTLELWYKCASCGVKKSREGFSRLARPNRSEAELATNAGGSEAGKVDIRLPGNQEFKLP